MMTDDVLMEKVNELKSIPEVRLQIEQRLREFTSFSDKDDSEWFSEMCFCLLTSNSRADTAMKIQEELGARGFIDSSADEIKDVIMKHKHRFHNNKTRFIMAARDRGLTSVRKTIEPLALRSQEEAREWLVSNVKGLAYKEASHFLRNVGFFDLAILDRHILNLMKEYGYIEERPKSLNRKNYVEIENVFKEMARMNSMSCAELDFYMWYMKAGGVLK